MGFWSSLVQSAVQVAHWVSNNSGSIGGAANTIAKIAGVALLTEEEIQAEGDNILPRLISDVSNAEKELFKAATKRFPQPTLSAGMTLRMLDLPALWPTPSTAAAPKVVPEIAMDINRLLACEKVPNSLRTDREIDVGAAVANQLFKLPPDEWQLLNGGKVGFNPVKITSSSASTTITGGICFYEIPLGNPGSHTAWHSHIRLYYLTSDVSEKAFAAEKLSLAIEPNLTEFETDSVYNSTTLSVQWNGACTVASVMSAAMKRMLSESKGKIKFMKPAVIDGTRFKYQFQTDTSVGPGEVAGALSAAIGNELLQASATDQIPSMPMIRVSNVQTYIS